jgi:hypothetical protein
VLVINHEDILYRKYITGKEEEIFKNNFKKAFGLELTQEVVDKTHIGYYKYVFKALLED